MISGKRPKQDQYGLISSRDGSPREKFFFSFPLFFHSPLLSPPPFLSTLLNSRRTRADDGRGKGVFPLSPLFFFSLSGVVAIKPEAGRKGWRRFSSPLPSIVGLVDSCANRGGQLLHRCRTFLPFSLSLFSRWFCSSRASSSASLRCNVNPFTLPPRDRGWPGKGTGLPLLFLFFPPKNG